MEPLRQRLLDWMEGSAAFPSFDAAACEVFRHQFEQNDAFRAYAMALGKTPANVELWQAIPAVPTDAFKLRRFPLTSFPREQAVKVFRTSGTTSEVRGEHGFLDLSLYEKSIIQGWRHANLPVPANPWFLSQSPANAPDSSLVHMFSVLQRHHAPETSASWMIDGDGKIDTSGLARETKPVALFATALALLRTIESGKSLPLPPGSWIFETGGYKGLTVQLDPASFKALVSEAFSVPQKLLLNEYGMTELSSPFYAWSGDSYHSGSPWTRVRVINPETGTPVEPGQIGYLEIVDLANLDSVAAIRTQDLAIARDEHSFTPLGRDPGALPRGCSRRSDDLISAS